LNKDWLKYGFYLRVSHSGSSRSDETRNSTIRQESSRTFRYIWPPHKRLKILDKLDYESDSLSSTSVKYGNSADCKLVILKCNTNCTAYIELQNTAWTVLHYQNMLQCVYLLCCIVSHHHHTPNLQMQNIRKCQVENLVASYQGHFNAALQYSGVMPGKSQNAVLQLYSFSFLQYLNQSQKYWKIFQNWPKVLENHWVWDLKNSILWHTVAGTVQKELCYSILGKKEYCASPLNINV